jgi:hypothetical protein
LIPAGGLQIKSQQNSAIYSGGRIGGRNHVNFLPFIHLSGVNYTPLVGMGRVINFYTQSHEYYPLPLAGRIV